MIIFLLFIPEKEEENNKEGLGAKQECRGKLFYGMKMRKPEILLAHTGGVWNCSEINVNYKTNSNFILPYFQPT